MRLIEKQWTWGFAGPIYRVCRRPGRIIWDWNNPSFSQNIFLTKNKYRIIFFKSLLKNIYESDLVQKVKTQNDAGLSQQFQKAEDEKTVSVSSSTGKKRQSGTAQHLYMSAKSEIWRRRHALEFTASIARELCVCFCLKTEQRQFGNVIFTTESNKKVSVTPTFCHGVPLSCCLGK